MWQMWTLKQLLHRWMRNNRKTTGKPGRSFLIWLFRLRESFLGFREVRSGKRVPRLAGFGCRNSKLAGIC
jgi:hypothetical protein